MIRSGGRRKHGYRGRRRDVGNVADKSAAVPGWVLAHLAHFHMEAKLFTGARFLLALRMRNHDHYEKPRHDYQVNIGLIRNTHSFK